MRTAHVRGSTPPASARSLPRRGLRRPRRGSTPPASAHDLPRRRLRRPPKGNPGQHKVPAGALKTFSGRSRKFLLLPSALPSCLLRSLLSTLLTSCHDWVYPLFGSRLLLRPGPATRRTLRPFLSRSRGPRAAVASEASRTRKSPSREKGKKKRADATGAADLDARGGRLYSSRPSPGGAHAWAASSRSAARRCESTRRRSC